MRVSRLALPFKLVERDEKTWDCVIVSSGLEISKDVSADDKGLDRSGREEANAPTGPGSLGRGHCRRCRL
jgi:hypothetical protein